MPQPRDPHEIPPHIRSAITTELEAIEAEHNVRVLWAVESGSRAWGFPSPDSDFDARFIYIHERDWYLSIVPGRDVIERPVDEVFDVSGWDLRKALHLVRAGNATLSEWLDSPIIYGAAPHFHDDFTALIDATFRPERSYFHYRSVAENHQASATSGDAVRLKKWLYALRTCLAAEWAATLGTKPPMRLVDLAERPRRRPQYARADRPPHRPEGRARGEIRGCRGARARCMARTPRERTPAPPR